MQFRIADTFTDSLARLTRDEQKAIKTSAFDLQMNPAGTGLSFHRIERARDKNFWSVRVNSDIRIIIHKQEASLLLCYVDHHDKAYAWAERRRLETHPKTGAAQIVELRETVRNIVVTQAKPAAPANPLPKLPLFAKMPDEELLSYGVPQDWLSAVKQAGEDSILEIAPHLPAEAAEALLELATGGKPRIAQKDPARPDPFDHPDAQRRFRIMTNVEELSQALDAPWDKWTIFLHPEQRQWVDRDYNGPARVAGTAGTGKTIVALHRAVRLARAHPSARVLLTTFSDTLANALRTKLKRLIGDAPRLAERVDVMSLTSVGLRLYEPRFAKPVIADRENIRRLLAEASTGTDTNKFGEYFLLTEWEHVVDAWQLKTWEDYRDVSRIGRKTRLTETQRKSLWTVFESVHKQLSAQELITVAGVFTNLAAALRTAKKPVYDYAVVDEAQDLSVAHIKFLAALGSQRPDALFFAGDLGQRIFQQPFSWKSLGVDVRGRSRTLRVNYRTSHQIRLHADRLLEPKVSDVDGNTEERNDTVSVFNGPPPDIRRLKTEKAETDAVAKWLSDLTKSGLAPHEIGVFVRSPAQIKRASSAVTKAGLPFRILDDNVEAASGHVSVGTMHLAKGLEFRAVAVMACDDEVIPLQERIETVGDDADLKEVYDTERHLLYVACTRARDQLLVTGVDPVSEFLDDFSTDTNAGRRSA